MGVIEEAVGVHSGAEKTPTMTEVGCCERGLLGGGRDESENMIHEGLTGQKITEGGINKHLF